MTTEAAAIELLKRMAFPRQPTGDWLLDNPERLSLATASSYLIGSVRRRTPLGASEYLKIISHSVFTPELAQKALSERHELVQTKMSLYSELFPREYRASQAPPFSNQREHEFYTLVSRRLFPLALKPLEDPRFFYPYIPINGQQEHDWHADCCGYETLQIMFRLVKLLSGRKPDWWRRMGLTESPAPPLNALGWTLFIYSLAVEQSPLRYMGHCFNLVFYRTRNTWLDAPNAARTGDAPMFWFEWSAANIAKLMLQRVEADRINFAVRELEEWLQEDPNPRIARVVELWNAAARTADREETRRE
jgi:hypothetical protein